MKGDRNRQSLVFYAKKRAIILERLGVCWRKVRSVLKEVSECAGETLGVC